MLNSLYKNCADGGQSLTPRALQRLKVFSLLAVIGFPLFMLIATFDLTEGLPSFLKGLIDGFLLASSAPLIMNGFYTQMSKCNAKLDEWELAQKRKAEAFTYRFIIVFFITSVPIALIFMVAFGLDMNDLMFSLGNVLSIIMSAAIIALFLPISYIVWTQKPLPLEE